MKSTFRAAGTLYFIKSRLGKGTGLPISTRSPCGVGYFRSKTCLIIVAGCNIFQGAVSYQHVNDLLICSVGIFAVKTPILGSIFRTRRARIEVRLPSTSIGHITISKSDMDPSHSTCDSNFSILLPHDMCRPDSRHSQVTASAQSQLLTSSLFLSPQTRFWGLFSIRAGRV